MSKFARQAILWLLPLAFAATLLVMRNSSLPFWQSFNLDPDYYYLLNGLRVVEGLAPTDVSHPGTPVHVLIAGVIRALYPFMPVSDVVDKVLANPEWVLVVSTNLIFGLVAISLWLMGSSLHAATGSLIPALLAQGAPFLSRIIPKFALHPKPEPFLVMAVALLIAALAPLTRKDPPKSILPAALAGVVMALGVACKVHFAVLGIIPLFLFSRRQWMAYVGCGALALMVFVAPALPSWDIWTGWISRMALGSGAYGEGAPTIIDQTRYSRAIVKLFSSKLIFTAAILAGFGLLAAYFRLRRRGLMEQDRMARLLVGIILAQILVVISVAKQPAAHYMVPALMLTGPALAALWSLSAPLIPSVWHPRLWGAVGVALVALQAPQMIKQNKELLGWTKEQMGIDLKARFPGCARIHFDAASSQSYAFERGDMNAQARYSSRLSALFPPDEYTWFTNDHTWWKNGLVQWTKPVHLQDVLDRHGCAVWRGTQTWTVLPRAQAHIPGFQFDDTCDMGEETLFTKGVRCDGSRTGR